MRVLHHFMRVLATFLYAVAGSMDAAIARSMAVIYGLFLSV